MKSNIIDETGNIYGDLKVLEYSHSNTGGAFWLCRCSCGKQKAIRGSNLRNGTSTSCGCKGKKTKFIKRFRESYDKNDSGCWIWNRGKFSDGYGQFWLDGTNVRAHRFSYSHFVGSIPKNMQVLHKCDVRACVNPEHLFIGSHKDNMRDMVKKDRAAHGESHHKSKLTDSDVKLIRKNYGKKGVTYRSIGKKYGVSKTAIRDIIIGKNRKVRANK